MNRPKYPPTKHIVANSLPDAYYKLVSTCLKEGAIKKRFYGKPVNTYDIISLTEINHPMLEPMLHPNFPTKELHLAEYIKQWDRSYDWIKQGFEYNYMDRLINYPIIWVSQIQESNCEIINNYYHKSDEKSASPKYESIFSYLFIDQLKVIRENIAKRIEKGGDCLVSNRDQVITWIPDRDMFVSEDQPCLQRIQFFVYEYPRLLISDKFTKDTNTGCIKGKAELHCMWRSRDLFAAWNSNMVGLITMLNKEIFEPNNLELIKVVDFCNSLHIYEADWESATKVKPAILPPNLMR
jgi:thymidylate synthase